MPNQFDMACPKCRNEDEIQIEARVWVALTADGTDADMATDGSHTWDSESPAMCGGCDYSGTVLDFSTE